MDDPGDLQKLTVQLGRLVETLEARRPEPPKRKDWSDRLAVVTPFISTVVVALLGLYFTQSAQRAEADRQKAFQDAQIAVQQAQMRVEEMKALTSVAPLLAHPDSAQRAVAQSILDAVTGLGDAPASAAPGAVAAPPPASGTPSSEGKGVTGAVTLSVIDNFARRARDARRSDAERIAALRQMQQVAVAPNTPAAVRAQALNEASQIAVSAEMPEAVRRTAADVIARIQSVPPEQIAALIERAPLARAVREIVVHHSGQPSSRFRGASSILGIAQFQLGQRGWRQVSWHYAIAPDGTVWLGMPLDEPATHARGHNAESVAVMLLLDGAAELPTPEQSRVFGLVMRTVQRRVGLSPQSPAAALRHTDIAESPSPCPGRLITQELVSSWIRGA